MPTLANRTAALLVALSLVACEARERADSDAAAANDPAREVAGTWNMRTLNMMGDSVLVTWDIVATADTGGWTLNFPGREPIPIHVLRVSEDSVLFDAGPYLSGIRRNVMVSTRVDLERRGDQMSGLITAVYSMPEGETTIPLRAEGTRAP